MSKTDASKGVKGETLKEKGPGNGAKGPEHLWFTMKIEEQDDTSEERLKKKHIEFYYDGYLQFYNQQNNLNRKITRFRWYKLDSPPPPPPPRKYWSVEVYIDGVAPPPVAGDPPPPKAAPPPTMP